MNFFFYGGLKLNVAFMKQLCWCFSSSFFFLILKLAFCSQIFLVLNTVGKGLRSCH